MGTGRKTAVLLLVFTFLLGIGVGFFAHGPIFFGMRGGDRGKMMRARLTDRYADELKLTPDQRTQIDRILEKSRRKMMAFRYEVIHPRFEALADSTRLEIEAVLTPDQKTKFHALTQRMKAGHRRNRWLPWRGP